MTTLATHLRTTYKRIALRAVPRRWVEAEPILAPYRTPPSLVRAIRNKAEVSTSDALVRALARLGVDDQDAMIVLLEAMTREVLAQLITGLTTDRFDEALVEAAVVVLDCEDLDQLDQLVSRLTRRVASRLRRRAVGEIRTRCQEVELPNGVDHLHPVRSVEGEVLARLQMEHVVELLHEAIDTNALPRFVWERFRDGRIAPALGFERSGEDRRRIHDCVLEVRKHLAHAS